MSQYTNAQIRNLMTDVFEDEEDFEFFVEDNFAEVMNQFEASDSFKRKAQTLAKYCQEQNLVDKLVRLISRDFPDKFKESGLPMPEAESAEAAVQAGPVETATPSPPAESEPAPASQTPAPVTNGEEPPDQPQNLDVFISYSRRDEEFIKKLYNALMTRGISTWYDRKNIGVATHWPTQIVEGIQNCKVFVLSLSPDSTASVNVRKEVDLAQRYKKEIVPLIWRKTEIPVGMEYQLAGIQWIDFDEDASPDKFNQLADVLHGIIGGSSLAEASVGKQIAKESTIPAIEGEPAQAEPAGGRRTLGGLKKKQTVSPIATGGSVISGVVTTAGLEIDDQNWVNSELKWLFSAADNFLKIRRGEINRDQPVAAPIPTNAEKNPQVKNQLLSTVTDFDLQIWEGQIESGFKRINIYLRNLDILLDQEARKGDAGKGDVYLQNQIKGARVDIIKVLEEMAQLMNQAYGVMIYSPEQLTQLLE